MGWLSGAVVQVVITSIVLGALKRAGIVRLDPGSIQNPAARDVFTKAIDFGEAVVERADKVMKEFSKK